VSIYDNDRLRQDVEGDFITFTELGQEIHGLVLDVTLKTFGDNVNPQYTLRLPDGREMKLTAGARDLKRQCFELRPERGDWLRVKFIRQEGGKGDQNGAKLFEVEVRHAAQQAPAPPPQQNGWGQQPYQPQPQQGWQQPYPPQGQPAPAPPTPGQWGQTPAPATLPYPQQQAAPPQPPMQPAPQPTQPVGQTQVPGMPPAAPVTSSYAGVDAMSPEQRAAMAAAGLDQPPF